MHPYKNFPTSAFWDSAVADRDPWSITGMAKAKWRLGVADKIGTAGSCFAQHIARHLQSRGFNFIDVEPAPPFVQKKDRHLFGYGVYSARYANIYTTTQLRQTLERAYGRRTPDAQAWEKGGRFYDPFRTQVEPNGFASVDELMADRSSHLRCVTRLFKKINVFVFTLGLTEAWRSKSDGSVFPIAPGVRGIGRFSEDEYAFVNFNFNDVYRDLLWSILFLKKINPELRFILTVSPVPLAATASSEHVLPATIYSKSVLRAVAGEIATSRDDVEYFPSYEIISAFPYRGMFYHPNLRDVSEHGVRHVMETFVREFCSAETAETSHAEPQEEDVVCEESILRFGAAAQ